MKKPKLPSLKNLQKKCDALLTPIIKKLFPRCLLCGAETQVAHHHIHKSQSSALRYEIANLINLCHKCHLALHYNESYHASRIVALRGLEWFEDLERKKNTLVKVDRFWYEENLERLNTILRTVSFDN